MKLSGTITYVGPVQSGTSKRGEQWVKQDFVLQYIDGQFPKSVLFSTMDSNIVGKLLVGQQPTVDFDIEVREWQNPQTGETRRFNEFHIYRNGISFPIAGNPQQLNYQQQAPAAPAPQYVPQPAYNGYQQPAQPQYAPQPQPAPQPQAPQQDLPF